MSEASGTQWSTIALDETKLRKTSIVFAMAIEIFMPLPGMFGL